jgi:hypothetical protein
MFRVDALEVDKVVHPFLVGIQRVDLSGGYNHAPSLASAARVATTRHAKFAPVRLEPALCCEGGYRERGVLRDFGCDLFVPVYGLAVHDVLAVCVNGGPEPRRVLAEVAPPCANVPLDLRVVSTGREECVNTRVIARARVLLPYLVELGSDRSCVESLEAVVDKPGDGSVNRRAVGRIEVTLRFEGDMLVSG